MRTIIGFFTAALALSMLVGCGIAQYPGQPGVVTNGYSKIDFEELSPDGLWVYEVSYDNRPGAPGVGAIITKLYRGAQTFTSNSRTNSDGTLYRVKGQYNGAEVQMISIPRLNQIILPANSLVMEFWHFEQSMDEVDDRNLAEETLFKPDSRLILLPQALEFLRLKLRLLRLGRLNTHGLLTYQIESMSLDSKKFFPTEPVVVETNLTQTAMRTAFSASVRKEFSRFLEEHFPTGFNGTVKFHLKNSEEAISAKLGVHTVATAQAAGITIIKNASGSLIDDTVSQWETPGAQ